ncbi:hypothetical protein [Erythrobacter tepidarius]|uniref:hypothetical protein n=1 Tax=Erythrobacter tepidarius TaxID=60454 RepID=UPI00117EE140|nr:hypothetical protein [Erythrobacter tepidarius]
MSNLSAPSRRVMAGLAAALALAFALPAAAQDQGKQDGETSAEAAPMTKGEKRLAKLLEGRVAGEPVRCIRTFPNMPMQTIEKTAYVYGRGDTIYVQRTRNPSDIDESDALVTQRFNASELCKLDQMTTVDRVLGFFTGAVFFDDFVPYTRVKDDKAG